MKVMLTTKSCTTCSCQLALTMIEKGKFKRPMLKKISLNFLVPSILLNVLTGL